jgi:hypothetical protein
LPPPDPEHLFQQANDLASKPSGRDADLRRAISTAYYGLFHFALTATADLVVGIGNRSTERYKLVYRSIDHSRLRAVCQQCMPPKPGKPQQPLPAMPPGGPGLLAKFAAIAINLQEQRIDADYDPMHSLTPGGVKVTISNARQAIVWFQTATKGSRRRF